jgi:hypothetical protein
VLTNDYLSDQISAIKIKAYEETQNNENKSYRQVDQFKTKIGTLEFANA